MVRITFTILFLIVFAAISPAEVDDLLKKGQNKTEALKAESERKRQKIIARFQEFKNQLKQLRPGLEITLPVDDSDPSKMRIADHNELTGFPEFKKVFAIVTETTVLKSWHSDTDSQPIERVVAGERVEVIMTINLRGEAMEWALVRKKNAAEGYLSQRLLKNPPDEKPAGGKINPGTADFINPVEGRISSKFGLRVDPVTKKSGAFHRGLDIMAPTGTPIKAAKDGEVFDSTSNKYFGHFIVLRHEGNLFTFYCHQSRTKSRKGERVKSGEVIGYVGRTGKATGPHLHFEVRVGQDPQDPLKFLN